MLLSLRHPAREERSQSVDEDELDVDSLKETSVAWWVEAEIVAGEEGQDIIASEASV